MDGDIKLIFRCLVAATIGFVSYRYFFIDYFYTAPAIAIIVFLIFVAKDEYQRNIAQT